MSENQKDKEAIIRQQLLSRRTVLLSGEITRENIRVLTHQLYELQFQSLEPINMIIDSGGGSRFAALDLCDLMEHVFTAPIRGIAIGQCGSAATFIMLHCKERLAAPHARFVIHSGSMSGLSLRLDTATAENLEKLLREIRESTELVIGIYMRKLEKSREEVQEYISRGDQNFDNAFSAQEAKDISLIHSIIEGKLDIFPKE